MVSEGSVIAVASVIYQLGTKLCFIRELAMRNIVAQGHAGHLIYL